MEIKTNNKLKGKKIKSYKNYRATGRYRDCTGNYIWVELEIIQKDVVETFQKRVLTSEHPPILGN